MRKVEWGGIEGRVISCKAMIAKGKKNNNKTNSSSKIHWTTYI